MSLRPLVLAFLFYFLASTASASTLSVAIQSGCSTGVPPTEFRDEKCINAQSLGVSTWSFTYTDGKTYESLLGECNKSGKLLMFPTTDCSGSSYIQYEGNACVPATLIAADETKLVEDESFACVKPALPQMYYGAYHVGCGDLMQPQEQALPQGCTDDGFPSPNAVTNFTYNGNTYESINVDCNNANFPFSLYYKHNCTGGVSLEFNTSVCLTMANGNQVLDITLYCQQMATLKPTPQMEATLKPTPQTEATLKPTPQMEATLKPTPQVEVTLKPSPSLKPTSSPTRVEQPSSTPKPTSTKKPTTTKSPITKPPIRPPTFRPTASPTRPCPSLCGMYSGDPHLVRSTVNCNQTVTNWPVQHCTNNYTDLVFAQHSSWTLLINQTFTAFSINAPSAIETATLQLANGTRAEFGYGAWPTQVSGMNILVDYTSSDYTDLTITIPGTDAIFHISRWMFINSNSRLDQFLSISVCSTGVLSGIMVDGCAPQDLMHFRRRRLLVDLPECANLPDPFRENCNIDLSQITDPALRDVVLTQTYADAANRDAFIGEMTLK